MSLYINGFLDGNNLDEKKKRRMVAGSKTRTAELESMGQVSLSGAEFSMEAMPKGYWMHHPAALLLRSTPRPSLWWFNSRSGGSLIHDTRPHLMKGCLREFCELHSATDAQILTFAQKWGVLGIWPGRYEVCPTEPEARALYRDAPHTFPDWQKHTWYAESTDLWRKVSAHFLNLLFINSKMQAGNEDISPEEWVQVVEMCGDHKLCIPRCAYSELLHAPKMIEYYRKLHLDTDAWDAFKKAFAEGVVSSKDIEKIALKRAVERWTKQITMSVQIELRQKDGNFSVIVVPVADKVPTGNDHQYWNLRELQKGPEIYALEPEPDLTNRLTFETNSIDSMHSSPLLNILVVQLVAALASLLVQCRVCEELFTPRHGHQKICTNVECHKKSDRDRKKAIYDPEKRKAKYVPVSQQSGVQ